MFENLATATGSKATPSRKGDTSAVMSAQVRLGTSLERNFYTWIKIMLNVKEKVSLWLPTQVPRVQPAAQQSGKNHWLLL